MASPSLPPASRKPARPLPDDAYRIRIHRVVDHIQANLGAPLTVSQLAGIACFSEFHFHRVFKAAMGESVYRFIRRLRLEKAAERLVSDPDMTITEVALMYGFATSAAFAKSFKSHFGLNATQWRRQFSQGDEDLFDRLYHQLFQWAVPRGHMVRNTQRFNIYHDNPEITDSTNLRVMAAIPVPRAATASDTVGIITLSGGLYAVCPLSLTKHEFVMAWEWMFAAWVNHSGYIPDDREMFERYRGERVENGQRVFLLDLCVPVKAK